MPGGSETTSASPSISTCSVCAMLVKVAIARRDSVIETVHVDPVHAPLHPSKRSAALEGTAVSVTSDPCAYASVQSSGHEIPAGAEVTLPLPVPSISTMSVGT